jgi:CheY-like chemotaxis protein
VPSRGESLSLSLSLSLRKAAAMASVLVIDDDDGTRDTYVRVLHLAGYETASAGNGRAGVRLALAGAFDLHLIDLRLPDMSGVDVVRELKLNRVAGRMVIVTAFPAVDTSFDAAAVGADGYVAGPLFGDDVVALVGRAIAGLAPVRATLNTDVENVRALARRVCALARLGSEPLELMAAALALRKAVADPSTAGLVQDRAPSGDVPHNVLTIVRYVDAHVTARELPRETDVTAEVGIDATDIGELLERHTGAGYREWRRLLRLRGAIAELAETSEHVAQIAFHIGYEHESQFVRDFHETFGLTPGQFRRLVTGSPLRA